MILRVLALSLALTSAAHAFVRSKVPGTSTPLNWVTNCIGYFINEEGSDDLGFEAVEDEVARSFDQWELPTCSDVRFTYLGVTSERRAGYFQGQDNRNLIVWREGGGDAIDAWEHDRSIIAVTTNTFCTETNALCPFAGAVLDSDIELNGERFTFTNSRLVALTRFDLGNTLVHEIGHLIGLDHSPDREATMYSMAPPGELIKRDLNDDDQAGVCTVFPVRGDGPGCYDLGDGTNAVSSDGCAARPGGSAPAAFGLLLALAALTRRRR